MLRVILLSLLVLTACTSKKPVTRMEPAEAMGQLRNDFAVLWDVRDTADLQRTGTAQMAQNVPADRWESQVESLSREKLVVVFDGGDADPRAEMVADGLSAKGFRVAILPGFDAWKAAGLPVKIAQ